MHINKIVKLRGTVSGRGQFLSTESFLNDEKCFLFHHKNSFRSRDIYIFVLTFWSFRKTA